MFNLVSHIYMLCSACHNSCCSATTHLALSIRSCFPTPLPLTACFSDMSRKYGLIHLEKLRSNDPWLLPQLRMERQQLWYRKIARNCWRRIFQVDASQCTCMAMPVVVTTHTMLDQYGRQSGRASWIGFDHIVEQYPSQRCALPGFPSPSKLTVECSQPFRECLLVRCAETEVLVFCNQLHAVGLTPGDRVNFDRIDDVGQWDDQLRCVFLFVLIECYILWSQNCP